MTDTAEDRSASFEAGRIAARNRWVLYFVGITSLIAGAFAILAPVVASFAAVIVAGGVLLFAGIAGLVTAWGRTTGWELAAAFALSLLTLVAGVLILAQPWAGILALTTLVIAYFVASGILRIWYGLRHRSEAGAGWMIAGGALSLVLGVLLWAGLPGSALWVPGVLLGVDLIMWGALMFALARVAGRRGAA